MLKIVKTKVLSITLTILLIIASSGIPASAKTRNVIVGGEPFGLKLYCRGVMITGFDNTENCPAKQSGLTTNDRIIKADSKQIKTVEEMSRIIENSDGRTINLEVIRNDKTISIAVKPKKAGKHYIIGAWIKDSCAGIGTISFYNADTKTYAALGHGICDSDTGALIGNSYGEVLDARITSVTKSENNSIGALNGYFTGGSIGTIGNNTEIGVFGNTENYPKNKEVFEVADISEVKEGEATLYTTVSSAKAEKYKVDIVKLCNTEKNSNKNFVVRITDDKLLEKTGGIVQGMSGSPIVQNGKLAGVLTHVFLEDCTCGYGIFADNMLTKC